MEILEKKEWSFETACLTCTSKLAVFRTDINFWSNSQSGEYTRSGYNFVCVVCKAVNLVGESSLPDSIKNDAAGRWLSKQN